MLSGRSPFSIPVSVVVRAPLDVIWNVETDFASYSSTYTGVLAVEPAGRSRSVANLDGTFGSGNGNANEDDLLGSKWNYARISVKEGQRYSTKVTVTKYERTEKRCSFTASTDRMLGATCSLKVIVEPIATGGAVDGVSDRDGVAAATISSPANANGQGDGSHTTQNPQSASSSPPKYCRVTHIVTMIPYQWYSPLRGIMCCMCLLKSRARMAIEIDMEDLTLLCEEKERERRRERDSSSLPPKAREGEGGISVCIEEPSEQSRNEQQQIDRGRQQEPVIVGDADVAGGGGGGGEP